MSGLGQNIHLLHCAAAVHAGGGSGADWGATMLLQWYWCQTVGVQQERLVLLVQVGAEAQQIHPDWEAGERQVEWRRRRWRGEMGQAAAPPGPAPQSWALPLLLHPSRGQGRWRRNERWWRR